MRPTGRPAENTFLPEGLLHERVGDLTVPWLLRWGMVWDTAPPGPAPSSTFPEALAIDSAVTAYLVPGAAVHQTASLSPAPEGLAQPCRTPHDGCPVTPVQLVS